MQPRRLTRFSLARHFVILCAVFLVQWARPSPADAWFLRWIDELSGPGPYVGLEFEWRLVCVGDPEGKGIAGPVGVSLGCIIDKREGNERPRASVNFGVGVLNSRGNELQYADPSTSRDIDLTTMMVSAWFSPVRSLNLGTGLGAAWFSGPSFSSFDRIVLMPISADFKPLIFIQGRTARGEFPWGELLSLRAGWLLFPEKFTPGDFGAVSGELGGSRESLLTLGAMFDLLPVFDRLKR